MTSPASRHSLVRESLNTKCDTSRSAISLAAAFRTARLIGFRTSPCGAVRPLRAWLVGIALLWSVLWVQLAIDHGTLGNVVAITLFATACVLTVLYGMRSYVERSGRATRKPTRITGSRDLEMPSLARRSQDRRASPSVPLGIFRSSAAGVGLIGAISWAPFSPLLAICVIGAFGGSPQLLLLAAAITCVIAVGGFVLLVLLIGLGRLLALWIVRQH